MTLYVILAVLGVIGWTLLGLRVFTWVINRTEEIFSIADFQRKVRFYQWFFIKERGEGLILFVASILALVWPLVLLFVVDAWRNHARKIREEVKELRAELIKKSNI